MSEEQKTGMPATNIQWLCRSCYEKFRDIPQKRHPERKKYRIWEAGRWQKTGECAHCRQWKQLTMYEWEDAEQKEERAVRERYRNRAYGTRKDTRAHYRGRFGEE